MSEKAGSEASRILWTRRLSSLFLLFLIGSTWKLWIPHDAIPAVPAAEVFSGIPAALDGVLLVAVIAGAVAWTLNGRLGHVAAGVLLLSLALLLVLDQLRWQPWALQAWLFIALIILAQPPQALRWLQWLTIGIYFHSSIAKLDYEFATTLGQQLLATLLDLVGVRLAVIPEDVRVRLAFLFPLAELAVAALLCFRMTARVGAIAAVVMHLATIAMLGPWGLGHQWGVLVWNLWLAVQTPVLFWPLFSAEAQQNAPAAKSKLGHRVAAALVVAAILLPFATRWGWWDTWPSWGLYAPGAERATVWVHELAVARLPPNLRHHVRGEETWRQLRVDRWALSELRAPLYPQNRVRLAVAEAIANAYQLGDLIRVELESPASRSTGERESRLLEDRREIQAQLDTYWINATPRS